MKEGELQYTLVSNISVSILSKSISHARSFVLRPCALIAFVCEDSLIGDNEVTWEIDRTSKQYVLT